MPPRTCPLTAFRPDTHRAGVGRAGGQGPDGQQYSGTHAYAIWSPVRQQWEFLTDQFKLLAEGTAYDAIDPGGRAESTSGGSTTPAARWSTAAWTCWRKTGCIRQSPAARR